jgi:6-phosphogluconolactonase (cycloisomerase 2 family)
MRNFFLLILCLLTACNRGGDSLLLFVGAYSDGSTAGISVYDFNLRTADFQPVASSSGIVNPSYLAVSPNGKFVFSVNETADGAVSSFALDRENGRLNRINTQPTLGGAPCYITLNPSSTALITANYSGGNLSVFPLNPDGEIGPLTQNIPFSPRSHIHTAVFSPDGQYLLVTDLGEDCIYIFSVSPENQPFSIQLQPEKTTRLAAGSGPRHLAFHPRQSIVYCLNERSGTITVFRYNDGQLSPLQTVASDLTTGPEPKGSADIHLSPDGRHLYSSNRLKDDGIAVFAVSPDADGHLSRVSYQPTGVHPRNFLLTPDGRFLLCANRDSDTIQIFAIDPSSGALSDTGKPLPHSLPVCLVWATHKSAPTHTRQPHS